MLIIAIIFREPTTHEKRSLPAAGFFRQLRACGSYLHQPMLAWIFLFSVLMVVLNHVPYEFYQPYTRLVGGQAELMGENTPVIAGVHMALVMFIASFVAGWSVRLRDRLGLGGALLTATALQTIIIAVMGFVLHPLVLVLVLLRSVPRALMTAAGERRGDAARGAGASCDVCEPAEPCGTPELLDDARRPVAAFRFEWS